MPYNIILSNAGPGYPGRVPSHPAKVPPAGSCFFERSEINGLGNGPFRFLVNVGGSAQWQKLHGGVGMDGEGRGALGGVFASRIPSPETEIISVHAASRTEP